MEPLIINPNEILHVIEEKFGIKFQDSILDFQYEPASHLFGIRFFRAKNVISDSIDEEGQIILNRDEKSEKIASLEILDLIYFLSEISV
ncbi:hypothetical protein ES706_04466 [subsurface metagenome]